MVPDDEPDSQPHDRVKQERLGGLRWAVISVCGIHPAKGLDAARKAAVAAAKSSAHAALVRRVAAFIEAEWKGWPERPQRQFIEEHLPTIAARLPSELPSEVDLAEGRRLLDAYASLVDPADRGEVVALRSSKHPPTLPAEFSALNKRFLRASLYAWVRPTWSPPGWLDAPTELQALDADGARAALQLLLERHDDLCRLVNRMYRVLNAHQFTLEEARALDAVLRASGRAGIAEPPRRSHQWRTDEGAAVLRHSHAMMPWLGDAPRSEQARLEWLYGQLDAAGGTST